MNQPTPGQSAVTTLTAKPGDKVDNYTIMEQIGTGGTAVVFRAHDHVLNRDVAIKQIIVPHGDAGDEMRQRAVAEASAHKRVAASDPKLLVQFIDIINDQRGLFLISEFIDGPSLEWILQQEPKPMEQRQALGIVAATAKALGAIHSQNMVHRDLKPSNILMPREGGLKLADFGLAAVVSEQQSMDLGSVRYMSPESLQGNPATAKSDLYSLGIVAYEMLAGREKFDEAFRTILRDQRNQAMRWVKWHTNARTKATPLSQLVAGIPQSLSDLVERMMEKDPARRVGSSNELLEAIRMHFAGKGVDDAPTPKPHAAMTQPDIGDVSATAEVPKRSKVPIILAAMLVIWGLAIGGFFVWQNQQKKNELQQRIVKVHNDIQAADRLYTSEDYQASIDAFSAVREKHGLREGTHLNEIIEAGILRASGMIDVDNKDFISAVDKFKEYEKLATSWSSDDAPGINVKLGYDEAHRLAENYEERRIFQLLANRISASLDAGDLNAAIEEIRRQRDRSDLAEDDLALLDTLESRHYAMRNAQRITTLLADAHKLADAGDLNDAIELLDEEVETAKENASPEVTTLLATLRDQVWLRDINRRIARAEDRNDREELLAALREKQARMPSDEVASQIRQIEIKTILDEASRALAAGEPNKAERLLNDVLDIEPKNASAVAMLGQIEGAKMQRAALTKADQLLADGQYQQAIQSYNEALKHGPDPDGQINAKIQQATGRIAQAAAEDALDKGNLDAAQTQVTIAIANLGETAGLKAIQQRIAELGEYRTLVTKGDEAFADRSYGSAKRLYLDAQKIFDSEEMRNKIRTCDFSIWITQCDAAMQRRDWEQAESALKRAEDIQVNDQTRSRRDVIENRVQ